MPDYGLSIAEDFKEYLKTGNDSLIAGYTAKELKAAVSLLSPYYDHNKQWYRVIQDRVDELEKREHIKQMQNERAMGQLKEQWMTKVIAFGLGFVLGLLF